MDYNTKNCRGCIYLLRPYRGLECCNFLEVEHRRREHIGQKCLSKKTRPRGRPKKENK